MIRPWLGFLLEGKDNVNLGHTIGQGTCRDMEIIGVLGIQILK